MPRTPSQGLNALEKAFKVLEAFGPATPELKLDELARETGMTRSSLQRLTHTLCGLGYLRRTDYRGGYALSHRFLNLSYAYLRFSHLLQVTAPSVSRLADETGLRADLAVLDDTEVVYLLRVPSRVERFAISPMGRRWRAISSAPGRAILSRLPEATVVDIAERTALHQSTARTTDKAVILERIAQAQRDGYAYQLGEALDGAASIAAPVIGATGKPIAAISLGTTVVELENEAAREHLAGLVVGAARGLSNLAIAA